MCSLVFPGSLLFGLFGWISVFVFSSYCWFCYPIVYLNNLTVLHPPVLFGYLLCGPAFILWSVLVSLASSLFLVFLICFVFCFFFFYVLSPKSLGVQFSMCFVKLSVTFLVCTVILWLLVDYGFVCCLYWVSLGFSMTSERKVSFTVCPETGIWVHVPANHNS